MSKIHLQNCLLEEQGEIAILPVVFLKKRSPYIGDAWRRLPCLGAKSLLPCYGRGVHASCILPGNVTGCFEAYGGRGEVGGDPGS